MTEKSQWIPISEATKRLKISRYKINAVIDKHGLEKKTDPRDTRQTLVNVEEIRQLLQIGE